MVVFSLVPLGTRLAALLLRASVMTTTPPPPSNDATAAPCANGAAAPVGATREDWLAVENLSGRGDEAAEVLGGRIAFHLEAGVADVRRRCEERGVDAGLLRGALAEAELLLGEFAADDAVILTIAREPDRIEGVVRRRAQKHRQNVGAGAEPFFDALVRAIIGEITRPVGAGDSRQEAADAAQPSFQSVLARIKNRSPRQAVIARCQLETLALLAASGVPARWLEFADEGSDDAREALNALIESSLCRLSEDGSTVELHPFQGRMIRESWETEPAHRERIEKEAVGLLDVVNAVFIRESQGENRRREALDLVDQLREIADQDYSRDLFADPRTGKILAAGLLYVMELEGVEAVTSLSDAVENLGRALGPDNSYTLISRNNLACAYRDAGRLSEAIDLFEQVLADRLRALEPDHLDILVSRNNLADAYELAERLDDAISLFEQNLTDCERILGPDHPGTLVSRNSLADAYKSAGRLERSIRLLEQNLTDHERILGADHPRTLISRNNLAESYREVGRLDEAITLHERNLADRLRILGPDHPSIFGSRSNLAGAYYAAGRLDEAIDLFEQSLSDRLRVLGPDHPDVLGARNNLAFAYRDAGRLDEAIDLYERVLADCRRIMSPDHPSIFLFRNNLAEAYLRTGGLDRAIDLYEQNLADRERVLGPGHPDTLTSRHNLATAYWSAGRPGDAILLFEQTLAEALRALGPDHSDTRLFRKNLADAYRTVGRDEDAEALLDPPPAFDDAEADRPDD